MAANNGTLSQSNASLVWATPTAQPVSAPARRVLLATDAACTTYRSFNVTNGTRISVSLVLDMTGLVWVNNTDPADRIAALLAAAFSSTTSLSNFTRAWTECTGVNASAVQVLQAPAVRTGLRPSPSQLAASAPSDAREFSGLGKGGLTAVVVVLIFGVLACCCFVLALCGAARCRRQQAEKDEAKGPHGAPPGAAPCQVCGRDECRVAAAAPSPGDLIAAVVHEAVCRPRAAAPTVSSV